MCQYLVFFIISFLTFGLQKRLLDDPAIVSPQDRRDLGMFGHQRRQYEDYFAQGHNHREARRRRSQIHQTRVGDGSDIKLQELTGHFPFDKEDGDNWETILEKSKQEADAMAAAEKAKDDAEMENQDNKEKSKKDQEDEQNSNSGGSDETSDESVPDESLPDESSDAPATPNPKYLVQYNAQNGLGPDPVPGKHGLTENPNYVPDTVPRKKACEFSPANCYCGARPTQQMDLLCASKKRAYCGWFCKHKMGGREGKPKLGPDQYGGNAPPKLKPEKRANPMGCPKPSLQTLKQFIVIQIHQITLEMDMLHLAQIACAT